MSRAADIQTATEVASKPHWGWHLSLPLAVILLFVSLRGVEWRRVFSLIVTMRPGFVVAGLLFGMLAYVVRAMRWGVLLNAQTRLGSWDVFCASSAGYLGNNFLPARAGEFIRSYMISSRSCLSNAYVLTTALTERLMDLVVLVLLGSIVLATINGSPAWLGRAALSASTIAFVAAILLALLPRMEQQVRGFINRLPLRADRRDKIGELAGQVLLGMRVLHTPKRLLRFSVLTTLIWLVDASGATLLARAMGLSMSLPLALLLLTGLGLGAALPSTPGAIGIYQFVAVTVLTPFHWSRSDAIAFILVAQVAAYVVITLFGLVGVWHFRTGAAT